MRWKGRRTSANIEDRRRTGGRRRAGGAAKIGGVGAVIVVLIGAFLGVDLGPLLGGGGMSSFGPGISQAPGGPNTIDDEVEEFVGVVLADTEEVWNDLFAQAGVRYNKPTLVLFADATDSACGYAQSAMGPFYCPADKRVFLDTSFFRVLSQQLGAGGDFAAAYVIAHEVGHHVQNELGTLPQVNAMRQRVSRQDSNALSVRVELQADCYAGLWARHAEVRYGALEPGDIDEALNAAARIGDDALQRAQGGAVVPDSFTHGSSEQRQRWFYTGYRTGDPGACDTFGTDKL